MLNHVAVRTFGGLDWIVAVAYVLLMIFATYKFRNIKSLNEFAIGNKTFGFVFVAMSLAATYIGPGFSMGATGKGYANGFVDYLTFLPFCLQTILVGLIIAPRISSYEGCTTIGQIFAKRSGKFAQVLAGISSVGICILFSAFLSKVAGQTISQLTGISFIWSVILVTTITAAYTTTGGFGVDVTTDVIQLIIMIVVMPIFLLFMISRPEFDFSASMTVAMENTEKSFSNMGIAAFMAASISFFFGETLIPPYATRALATKTPADARKSFVAAGIFGGLWLGLITLIGICSRTFPIDGSNSDNVLVAMGAYVLPDGIWGLLLITIASIVMSSQDSVLNSGAVAMTTDLVSFSNKESVNLWVVRAATVLIAIIGAIAAGWLPGIIESLLFIYSIWAPAVLVPLLLILFTKGKAHRASWLSMIFGLGATVVWRHVPTLNDMLSPIMPSIVIAVIAFAVSYHFENSKNSISKTKKE